MSFQDIFFYKASNSQIKKPIYFTIIYRCDQSTSDNAVIADVGLEQFRFTWSNKPVQRTRQRLLLSWEPLC